TRRSSTPRAASPPPRGRGRSRRPSARTACSVPRPGRSRRRRTTPATTSSTWSSDERGAGVIRRGGARAGSGQGCTRTALRRGLRSGAPVGGDGPVGPPDLRLPDPRRALARPGRLRPHRRPLGGDVHHRDRRVPADRADRVAVDRRSSRAGRGDEVGRRLGRQARRRADGRDRDRRCRELARADRAALRRRRDADGPAARRRRVLRLVLAAPLVLVASRTTAGVAVAGAGLAGALAPLLLGRRRMLPLLEGGRGERFHTARALRFAGPAATIAASDQLLVNGAPLLVFASGGSTKAAGLAFAATMLVRAPVYVFQGVAAALLPNLTRLNATDGVA